jgi:hypothetical protein
MVNAVLKVNQMNTVDYDAIINLLIRVWKDEPLDGHAHKNSWQLVGLIEKKFPDINYAELKKRPENFRAPLARALEELMKTDVVAQILIRNLTRDQGKTSGAGSVNQQVNISGDNNRVTLAGGNVAELFNTQRSDRANEESPQAAPAAPLVEYNSDMNPNGLLVFLCHSSADKPRVRELCHRLRSDGFSPWLDEEQLLPGQQWDIEIKKTIKRAETFIVCLSKDSTDKRGYVQKEIKLGLDAADEIPEGEIFIIPLKLEECEIPDRLSKWQWEYFDERGYGKLIQALRQRAAKRRQ